MLDRTWHLVLSPQIGLLRSLGQSRLALRQLEERLFDQLGKVVLLVVFHGSVESKAQDYQRD